MQWDTHDTVGYSNDIWYTYDTILISNHGNKKCTTWNDVIKQGMLTQTHDDIWQNIENIYNI